MQKKMFWTRTAGRALGMVTKSARLASQEADRSQKYECQYRKERRKHVGKEETDLNNRIWDVYVGARSDARPRTRAIRRFLCRH